MERLKIIYHIPPDRIYKACPQTPLNLIASSSMVNIIISKAAVPMEDARFPYTENMEKKKESKIISIPIKTGYLLINPVKIVVKKTKRIDNNMPFLLWFMGPGLSAILAVTAPREIVMPINKRFS
jgi:hypothetical protein